VVSETPVSCGVVLGGRGRRLGCGWSGVSLSLAEILSWVVAFPAALVGQCLGYSSLFPPAEPATALGRLRASLGNDPGRFPATLIRKIPGPRAVLPWSQSPLGLNRSGGVRSGY
jgi:hypothetical protein